MPCDGIIRSIDWHFKGCQINIPRNFFFSPLASEEVACLQHPRFKIDQTKYVGAIKVFIFSQHCILNRAKVRRRPPIGESKCVKNNRSFAIDYYSTLLKNALLYTGNKYSMLIVGWNFLNDLWKNSTISLANFVWDSLVSYRSYFNWKKKNLPGNLFKTRVYFCCNVKSMAL